MTKIRIDTEHAREVGRRLVAEGDRMDGIGQELQSAIGGLDTGSWDGISRARAEPMLDRVRPEVARVADGLDELGRKLRHVAEVFEQEDGTAARNLAGMGWVDWDTGGDDKFWDKINDIIRPRWPFPGPPPWWRWRPLPWPPRYWPWLPILPILPLLPPLFRPPWRWPRPGIPKSILPLPVPFPTKPKPEPTPEPSPQPAPKDTDTESSSGEESKPPGHASPPEQPAPDVPSGIERVEIDPDARTGDCVDFVEDHRKVPGDILNWQNGGVDNSWNYGPAPKPGAIMVEGYDPEIGIGAEIEGTKWGHVSYVDWVEYNEAGEPIRFHVVEGGWKGKRHEQTFDWPIGDSSRRHPHRFIYDKKS